jgi:hypothetical protein
MGWQPACWRDSVIIKLVFQYLQVMLQGYRFLRGYVLLLSTVKRCCRLFELCNYGSATCITYGYQSA